MKGLIFTYVLTYGGAVTSLFNPFVGLLIYVCFAIVKPEDMWYWSVPQGNYSRIVAVALLLGWAGRGFGNWNFGRARPVVIALVLFWLWSVVAAVMAPEQETAWKFVELQAKIVLPFLVGITVIDSVAKLKTLAWVILLSQGYIALEANLSYFSGYNRLWEEGFGSLDNNSVAIAMVTCLGMTYFLGTQVRWWARAVVAAVAALLIHAILFSFSRGGMLGMIVTGAVTFLFIPKKPKHYLALLAVVLLVVRLAGAEVVARFETTFAGEEQRDGSAQSRLQLWSACWESMKEQPLGLGPNHWPLVSAKYGFEYGKEAHTLWLQVGAELGFPGLLCLVAFYGTCVLRLLPWVWERWATDTPWFRDTARMVVAGLVGFAVSAQFVSLKALELPYYVTLIGASGLVLCSRGVGASAGRGAAHGEAEAAGRGWAARPES